MWWHLSFWGVKGNTKAFSWGNMKKRDHLEDLDVDLRKIIKKDFRWIGRVDWIYVTQDTDTDRDRDKCPVRCEHVTEPARSIPQGSVG